MFRAPWTLFAQTRPAAKEIQLRDGALKTAPPVITSAVADPRWSTAQELATALSMRAWSVYARWGHPTTGRRSWALTHADRNQRPESTITHLTAVHPQAAPDGAASLPVIGLGDVRRPDGAAWFAVDIDPDGRVFSRAQALAALEAAAPGISQAPRVEFDSSSGWIRAKGGPVLREQRGLRILIGFMAGSDIERAAAAIFARLWLKGFGWATVTDSGRLEPRTLIDMALVRNQSQPDFFLPARLGPGLESFAPPVGWCAGEGQAAAHGFDSVALVPDLTEAEAAQVKVLQDAAMRARHDEAQATRSAYVLARATEDAARRGTTVEEEAARRRAALDQVGAVVALDGDTQICTRAHGWLTVREIGQRGLAAFKDAYCADPAEPDYRSTDGRPTTGRAVIQRASEFMVQIMSFAHGAGTRFVWLDGGGLLPDSDDMPTEASESAASEAPATWTGSGVEAWNEAPAGPLARALGAEADEALAEPDLSAAEAAWLTKTLAEAGAFRHLHMQPHDPRMNQMAIDIAGLRARSVAVMRRGQNNTTLLALGMDADPPLEPASAQALAPAVAEDGTPRLVLGHGAAGLDALADAAASAARAGRRVEVLVADAARDSMAALVAARGLTALVRPSRTGKDGDEYLCLKHEAVALQTEAGYRDQFFASHCMKARRFAAPLMCPYFDVCGYNRAMAGLGLAHVVVARAGSVEGAVNALLEEPAPSVMAAEPPQAVDIAWSDKEVADPAYAAIAPIVQAVIQGLRSGIPVEALGALVTQDDKDLLSRRSVPPKPASPTDTAEQARIKTARLRPFKRQRMTPPWDIAWATLALVSMRASVRLGDEGKVAVAVAPTFLRLRAATAATLLSATPLDAKAAAQAARALGALDRAAAAKAGLPVPAPTVVTRIRVAPSSLPAKVILLSSRPRVLHSDPDTHADVDRLASAVRLACRFGQRVTLVVHAEAARKALQEAVGEAARVITPNAKGLAPADLIVATAALPRHSAGGWHARGWTGPGSVAAAGVAPLRVVPPTVLGAPSTVMATLQRLPAREDSLEAFRAAAYALVEALVATSTAAGVAPTVLILDTVPPRWPVHAVVHRDLLVPADDRALAAVEVVLDDPFIESPADLARALQERHPDEFATAKAARLWVDRHALDLEGWRALASVWTGRATPEMVARMAEVAGLAEVESGAAEQITNSNPDLNKEVPK